ncbi:24395_t:CDS:2 [Gigaspora rosea]|nr:24395_t:CDS:2 [Gigaspora rosea]
MGFCTDGFTPGGRSGHESVLIGNKLYIMGGLIQYYKIQHLNSTSPMLYGVSKGAALAGGISKSYIFLIAKGAQPNRRSSTLVAIDQFGVAFDTETLLWRNLSDTSDAPMPRSHATATLLPDGKIIYIGGVIKHPFRNQTTLQPMLNEADASFDVHPRIGHTAILTPDSNSIILFGGTSTLPDEINQIAAYPNFLVLTIEPYISALQPFNYKYKYLAPQPSGNQPSKLSYHTANLYKDQMIVSFGNIIDDIGTPSTKVNSNVYILSIKYLTWMTYFFEANRDGFSRTLGSISTLMNIELLIYHKINAFQISEVKMSTNYEENFVSEFEKANKTVFNNQELSAMHPQAVYSSRFISNNELDLIRSQTVHSITFTSHNELKVGCSQIVNSDNIIDEEDNIHIEHIENLV